MGNEVQASIFLFVYHIVSTLAIRTEDPYCGGSCQHSWVAIGSCEKIKILTRKVRARKDGSLVELWTCLRRSGFAQAGPNHLQ